MMVVTQPRIAQDLPSLSEVDMRLLHTLAVAILLAMTAAPVLAQSQITTGVIDGVVIDANGGVMPGVSVEVRNVDTNLTRTLVTGPDGRFSALQLTPGRYTVTFSLSGFSTLVQENVVVTVGQSIRLNPTMKVSGIAETVTVTTEAPAVDTTRTAAASTLDETTIASTPILGRKFEDLLTLTPGVSVVQGPDGDEITFSGQRGVFNNVSLDGGDYTNGFFGEQVGGQRAAIDITLEAVKEFQVIAAGASAEFGHTAGGVVNVITKSGTNQVSGSIFHYQRLEGLTSHTSDGKPLTDFHREQFGGTVGGPVVKDKAFYFLALEGVRENLQRPNLSEPIGTPCPVAAPTLLANEALIGVNGDCQRLALLGFFQSRRNQNEGLPIDHTINNSAMLAKVDWNLTSANQLSASYNFDYSKNVNQTFDVATYGTSANGIEGPSKINVLNVNLFTTLTTNRLNEFHVTYSREGRPRSAVPSSVPADTAMGFATSFRFGNPFFMQPNVDEIVKRFQVKNNLSLVSGTHTIKATAVDTGVITTTLTNDAGTYTFGNLAAGKYTISASLTGFQTKTITDAQLSQGTSSRYNFEMNVAGATTQVEVTIAADSAIATQGASIGQELDREKVAALPIVGNNILDLITVMAGVQNVVATNPPSAANAFGRENTTFAGVRADNVMIVRDGIDMNDNRSPNLSITHIF